VYRIEDDPIERLIQVPPNKRTITTKGSITTPAPIMGIKRSQHSVFQRGNDRESPIKKYLKNAHVRMNMSIPGGFLT
jgi:hypothetical protein